MAATPTTDSVVAAVVEKFQERSRAGIAKYGVTLDRTDLSVLDWIRHAQEEHMDAILYLEKLKRVLGGAVAAPSAAEPASVPRPAATPVPHAPPSPEPPIAPAGASFPSFTLGPVNYFR